jgi:hypothetical protein
MSSCVLMKWQIRKKGVIPAAGLIIPLSMRNVDGSADANVCQKPSLFNEHDKRLARDGAPPRSGAGACAVARRASAGARE